MPLNNLYTFSRDITEDIRYQVKLNSSHPIYKGHFPDEAITPGAILLQILKDLVEKHLGKSLNISHCSNVKFLTLVDPMVNQQLIYKFEIENNSDGYQVKTITSFPEGNIVLKCNATFVERQDH